MENRMEWLEHELEAARSERDTWKRRYWKQKGQTHHIVSLLSDEQLLRVIESDPEVVAREKCSFLRKKLQRILETLPEDHPARNLVEKGGE
ncbi:MAG: hypothetical protein RSB04_12690 [Gordonibacter sp.]|uniref:hypothetical protein n=1 Tax=Gordonibacter sp. TaxID=1968902 RepID=UPI002FC7B777